MNLYIKVEGRNWNAPNYTLLETLGVKRLPAAGLPPQLIQGIKVWAEPLRGEKPVRGKRHTHRLLAECPVCAKQMSAGRLHQHSKVHRKCERCGSVRDPGQSCGCFDNGSQ